MGRDRAGAKGADVVLKVPVGTEILDEDNETLIADLDAAGQARPARPRRQRRLRQHPLQVVDQPRAAPRQSRPGGRGALALAAPEADRRRRPGRPAQRRQVDVPRRRLRGASPRSPTIPSPRSHPSLGVVAHRRARIRPRRHSRPDRGRPRRRRPRRPLPRPRRALPRAAPSGRRRPAKIRSPTTARSATSSPPTATASPRSRRSSRSPRSTRSTPRRIDEAASARSKRAAGATPLVLSSVSGAGVEAALRALAAEIAAAEPAVSRAGGTDDRGAVAAPTCPTVYGGDCARERHDPHARSLPPHRRQDRLVAAGRPRQRQAARPTGSTALAARHRAARQRRPRRARGLVRRHRARPRRARPARAARSSWRRARPPPPSARSRSPAPGRRRSARSG